MHPAKAEGAGIIMRRWNPFRLGIRKTEETPALPAPQEEEVDLVEIPRFPEDGEAETDKISVSKRRTKSPSQKKSRRSSRLKARRNP